MMTDGVTETLSGPTVTATVPKSDPSFSSFKSKRYRDKLRTEIKALEAILPVEKTALHRKLDSQTVFRLTIAYFRTKIFLEACGLVNFVDSITEPPNDVITPKVVPEEKKKRTPSIPEGIPNSVSGYDDKEMIDFLKCPDLLEAMDGFLLVITADGTILYVSRNILHHLGFNQVDLMMRCTYGIVHPDDHHELKMVLEHTLTSSILKPNNQQRACCVDSYRHGDTSCRSVSFLCRMKCFNGTTTGYLKMHCIGHMRSFPKVARSQRTANTVLFAFCRPFISISTDPSSDCRSNGFWTKHELDLKFRQMEDKIQESMGYSSEELEGKSLYSMIHPEDLAVFSTCHKSLIQTEEIQTMYFRMQHQNGSWVWLHTKGKVVFKNSKKYSIVFTHCPVREEDSSYIQQEVVLRQKYALYELVYGRQERNEDGTLRFPPETEDGSLLGWPPNDGAGSGAARTSGGAGAAKMSIYGGLRDDPATSALHDPHGQCPSSWHTSADRHSPVFPNNHLPHPSYKRERATPTQEAGPAKTRKRSLAGVNQQKEQQQLLEQQQQQQQLQQQLQQQDKWLTEGGYYCDRTGGDLYPQIYQGDPGYVPNYSGNTPGWNNHQINTAKKYHMHFNGLGFGTAYSVQACAPVQYSPATLVIQGHVTTIDTGYTQQCPLDSSTPTPPTLQDSPHNTHTSMGSSPLPSCAMIHKDTTQPLAEATTYYQNNNYISGTGWGEKLPETTQYPGTWNHDQTQHEMALPGNNVKQEGNVYSAFMGVPGTKSCDYYATPTDQLHQPIESLNTADLEDRNSCAGDACAMNTSFMQVTDRFCNMLPKSYIDALTGP